MKRVLALIVALVLVLGTSASAFAFAGESANRPLIPHEVILDVVETYEAENGVEVGPGDEIPIPDDIVEKYIGERTAAEPVQTAVATATEEPLFDYPVIPHEVVLEIVEEYKAVNGEDIIGKDIPIPDDIVEKYIAPLRETEEYRAAMEARQG